ncbi:MarR family winged helix-turn-helix transcriptional regulator [Frondihabitans australicus]|uniref:DNA-binding MarR family transcriptional regulator n=1 Tax=Frondihabitans australicus TaxID=386892 RepID=A0A495IIT3_9MICO|nr:MarR family transcriptional regulator [Frondihabitans australicus]RKR75610.1 DNA-binding MarR family transcriptional regulator [Frondihabitans australicus]
MTTHVKLEALGRAVKQAQWRHHRAMESRLTRIGTTLVQWDSLRAISERPGASAHELANATFMSDQAFGTLSKRLLAQDLIVRAPGAGRRVEHRLTRAGEKVLREGSEIAEAYFLETFADLDDDERDTLYDLLNRIGR